MGLFTTKTKRTYHRTKPKRGWSTTSKASTRAKRWAKRRTKKLWRTTKRRIRNRWRKYQRTRPRAVRNRQIARRAQQFRRHNTDIHNRSIRTIHPTTTPSYQLNADGTAQATTTQAAGQARLPPPDGATASCRRCANEVQYSAGHGRWEHTGHGHYECFQPGGYDT